MIDPNIVNLTVGPYADGPIRHFTLDWRDGISRMNMSGDSRNTSGNTSISIAGSQIEVSGTVGYQQTCELEFGWTSLEGTCEFRRYEVTFPSSDICQGKYWISGRKF